MPTTHGRSRGRQGVHSGARGATGDHTRVIMATMVATAVIVIFVLIMTTAGRTIDAATQHFMLFYAGVFALIGLTGSVLVGLIATDRIVMTPGHRVMAQAVHRAMSFGALTFLVIHIVTEILAQRVHVIDAFIPFLSPFRTFYIGLGTIASDLIILIVVTSILRKRFTAHGRAWRWRAIHYSSYAAFVLGVLHGLLGGRAAKPYVDWSYGVAIALTALGLAVRFLAISLRPKEKAGAAPGADRAGSTSSASLQAAALSLAQAQLGGPVQVLPAGMGVGSGTTGMPNSDSWPALSVASGWSSSSSGWSSSSGPIPALRAGPAYAAADTSTGADLSYPAAPSTDPYRSPDSYLELGFAPLGAPPYGDDGAATLRGRPYVAINSPMQAQAARPAQPVRGAWPGNRFTSPSTTGHPGSRERPGDMCRRMSCRRTRMACPVTGHREPGTRIARDQPDAAARAISGRSSPPVQDRQTPVRPARAKAIGTTPARPRGQAPVRCPALIPARFRVSVRASSHAAVPVRCPGLVPVLCRELIRARCRAGVRVRCPGLVPVLCRELIRARCRAGVRVRCPGLVPVQCRELIRARCRARVRVRCPGLGRVRCPAKIRAGLRVSATASFRAPTLVRCRRLGWERCPVQRPVRHLALPLDPYRVPAAVSGRGRAQVRCRMPKEVRDRALGRVPCQPPGRVRCPVPILVRCPVPIPVRCPVPILVRSRVSAPVLRLVWARARRHGLTPARRSQPGRVPCPGRPRRRPLPTRLLHRAAAQRLAAGHAEQILLTLGIARYPGLLGVTSGDKVDQRS